MAVLPGAQVVLLQNLRAALADTFAAALPLDTQLGQQWGGTGVSGGQWQRLALARIHLRNAYPELMSRSDGRFARLFAESVV